MAAYSSYSPQDQAVVQNTVNLIRAAAGELCRQFNHMKAISDDSNALALLSAIDTGTGPGAIIPNTSGLGGADDMTRDEMQQLYQYINNIRINVKTGGTGGTDNFDTPNFRAMASKAAGINAMFG